MSKRQDRKLQEGKYQALKIQALNLDLDPDGDYARPGNRPSERAFHLLSCGFDILVAVMEEAFPAVDRRAVKTGSKWARESFVLNGAPAGAFLARAAATLLAEMHGRLSEEADDDLEPVLDPEFHMSLRRSVEDFYPKLLPRKAIVKVQDVQSLLDSCQAEFEVLKTGEPRKEVTEGEEHANRYSLALMRGEDPSSDPELAREQREYARDYYIHQAVLGGVATSMYESDVRRLLPKTIPYLDPADSRMSDYRARALRAWVRGSRPYREYALMDFRNASPSAVKEEASRTGS
jgi:hypothetical protein